MLNYFHKCCNLSAPNPVYHSEGPKTKGSVIVTDNQIIDLFWNRNEDAIAATDGAYGRKLRGLSRRILQNLEDSEEVVNDTYLKTWDSIPEARPQHFYAYIAAICRNLSLNLMNWNQAAKRKAEIVSITEELQECIPDAAQDTLSESKEIIRALNAFLETLPEESRLVFIRRYWYADSVAAIAKRYGKTESSVKTQLHRTRNKLYLFLKQEGIYV